MRTAATGTSGLDATVYCYLLFIPQLRRFTGSNVTGRENIKVDSEGFCNPDASSVITL
jgi:hypothetical protein